jgi:hypothetical protein
MVHEGVIMTSRLRLVQRSGLLGWLIVLSACTALEPLAVDESTLEEIAAVSPAPDLLFECTVLEGGRCVFLDPLTETALETFERDLMVEVIDDLGQQHVDESISSTVRVRCIRGEDEYSCSIFRGGTWQDLPVE